MTSPLDEIKAHYQRGGLGDGNIKKRLEEKLQALLAPIRERREQLAKDRSHVVEIIRRGTRRARDRTETTKHEVINALGLIQL
ncbi:hypothetical protein [Labrenzia sp. C1B10]|uniref:hypothetical protein n=1 Tax=Labrenzia sp. C1B10 TaxID=1397530 RepID=UPI0012682CD8|nr:hypothetical protein [Labrenzia sp. C1B10]